MTIRFGLLAGLLLGVSAYAQEPQTSNLQGRLRAGDDAILHGFVVELDSVATHVPAERADVESGGEFSFRNLPYGEYLLKVTTYDGDTVAQQFISVHDRLTPLEIRLPAAAPVPAGTTVSLAALRHPPARKALEACAAAQRFASSGQYGKAAVELEKAVRLSPDFAPAHTNLGVQYLRIERFEDAQAEIRRALELAGPNPRDLANLAFAQAALQRLPEAAASARAALRLEPDSPSAHYILGMILALDRQTRGEGVAHLEVAAKSFDSARRALQRLE